MPGIPSVISASRTDSRPSRPMGRTHSKAPKKDTAKKPVPSKKSDKKAKQPPPKRPRVVEPEPPAGLAAAAPAPECCVQVTGNVPRLLRGILHGKLALPRCRIVDGKVWCPAIEPDRMDKAVGRYRALKREIVVRPAAEGDGDGPGPLVLDGAYAVLSDFLQRELAAFGVVGCELTDGGGRFTCASEEFVGRLVARRKHSVRGITLKFERVVA